jgi:predicted nucleic-acid-binding protein
MRALDINEGIKLFKKREKKTSFYMNSRSQKFLNNIVLTKITDFFDENIKYSRDDISEMIHYILKNREFTFENRETVEIALDLYKNSKEPFSDCLNESVNRKYSTRKKPKQKSNSLMQWATGLFFKHQPSEAQIRSIAPSNLPIHF